MSVSNELINRRQLRRHKLSVDIGVLDKLKEDSIGRLVDIHQAGLLMLGNALTAKSSHQLSLILPNSINRQTHFEIGIECLWCHPCTSDDTLFWVGGAIIDKSKNASACIQSLINITSQ